MPKKFTCRSDKDFIIYDELHLKSYVLNRLHLGKVKIYLNNKEVIISMRKDKQLKFVCDHDTRKYLISIFKKGSNNV